MFWTTLLIVHGLLAVGLLGAVTHQAFSVARSPGEGSFIASYGAVRSRLFTNPIIVLYLLTFLGGGWIYAQYRIAVRPVLEDLGAEHYVGLFEFKEHVLAIALFVLPSYWLLWQRVPLDQQRSARTALTWFVAACVWIGLIAGHLVNNAKGL